MRRKTWAMVGLLAVGMSLATKGLAGSPESSDVKWAIPYGQEFWRQAQPASKTAEVKDQENAAALAKSGFNLGDVMERVACSFRARAEGEAPAAEGRTYRAVYEGNGVAFSPFLPAKSKAVERISKEPSEARFENKRVEKPDPNTLPSPDPDTLARFHTIRVSVGDTDLYNAANALVQAEESTLGNTIQRLLSAETCLVEHWQTRREGMEVAWVLQKPPVGSGPLVIEVEAAGLYLVGATANAVHYGNGGVGRVRISGAMAIDAAGRHCELAMRADGGRIVYELPETFLASAVYPLAVDPTISAEFGIDNPVLVPAPLSQWNPAVAWNGTESLVIWCDGRNGADDIYGARVSFDGAVLDPLGIVICEAENFQYSPSITWDGNNFFVVWEDIRSGTSDIYGARVSSTGVVLDPEGIAISTAAEGQNYPSIAWNGTHSLVVWIDQRNGWDNPDIYGARVGPDGAVLDSEGIAISTAASYQSGSMVAWDGTDFLVVWNDSRSGFDADIYGARVGPDGAVLDPDGIVICAAVNYQLNPSLTWNGTEFLVAWYDERNGSGDIYGTRMSSDVVALDPDGIAISTAETPQVSPAIAWNGTDFLVVWDDSRNGLSDIYGARVSSDGNVLDPDGIPISTAENLQWNPGIAWNGTDFLVVWDDGRSGWGDIYGARVSSDGAVIDNAGIILSNGANFQWRPSVVRNGSEYLVVWADDRNGFTDIYGARVSADGNMLDPDCIAICADASSQEETAVAWNGTDYLVVWIDDRNGFRDVYGARVSAAGIVLEPDGIPICADLNYKYSPSVAWNGTDFLVVWASLSTEDGYFDIYGTRVGAAGEVRDPAGIVISAAAGNQSSPSVAWDGVNSLVVWIDDRSEFYSYHVYGARVNSGGEVLDPDGIAISTTESRQRSPSVAWNGTDYLVVWVDDHSGASDIYGTRVSSGGAVLDLTGIAISSSAERQEHPSVAWDGANFLVVWDDERNEMYNYDIYGARVSSAGVVLDPDGLAVDTNEWDQQYPAIAGGPDGQSLMVCEGTMYGARRVAGVMIQDAEIESTVTVEASNPTAGELGTGYGRGTFTFTRTEPLMEPLTLNFAVGGTATPGSDYMSIGTTVSFAAGSATATKTVRVLDDCKVEGDETVVVTLANGTGYKVGSPSEAVVTIKDDEALVRVFATDAIAGEPGTRYGRGTFTFIRTPPWRALTVNFTVSGTATTGSDYTSLGTTVSFAAGSATATKTVKVLNDHLVEGDETVRVTLVSGAGYNLGSPSSTAVTIKDDDP